MNIIYAASTCSQHRYREYVESKGARVSQQAQKYNLLLAEGLVGNGVTVDLVSSRPINRTLTKQLFFKGKRETEHGVTFHYVPFVNFKMLRELSVFFGVFVRTLLCKRPDEPTVVLCDALNIATSAAALCAAKLLGMPAVGIVTDVPCHRPNNQKIPLHERINLWLMKRFDRYLLLTEQMNDIVNPKKKPYVVLEGHADEAMMQRENRLTDKHNPRVCLYAGSLRRIYGIEHLVRGFIAADLSNTELHIYGNGDFVEDLKELCEKYPAVKYCGIAPNEVVVEEELKATLLVNPRPTNEDYTQYSFPSKNMEYMASGTPVLTTRLPGMPAAYEPFVFLIEEENAEGITRALKAIFSADAETLHRKGAAAKAFVMEEKNNVVQAKKVLEMLEQ